MNNATDSGVLSIVATPIGNREDITLRALGLLLQVPVIACEDTRRTGLLLQYYRDQYASWFSDSTTAKPQLISFYDEIEQSRTPDIITLLQSGTDVALVSDAGTPLISDPGFNLVRECHRQNIPVSPIPGPSSVIAALSVSGMPTDTFTFFGYLPKKQGKRHTVLQQVQELRGTVFKTVVLLETPHRITKTLQELYQELGNVDIAICSELTKMHERIIRGKVSDVLQTAFNTKGEFVVIVSLA